MYCKHYCIRCKKRIKYSYCRLLKKEVSFSCYQDCDKKEFKIYKSIPKITKKRSKKGKERFSNFTSNLSKCIKCGSIYCHIDKHELFPGK